MVRRFAGFCVAIGVVCAVGHLTAVTPIGPESATAPTENIPPGKKLSPARDLKYVGVGSCSAAACHGGPLTSDPTQKWKCAYTIWATQEPQALSENRSIKTDDGPLLIDKHNRAYTVLLEDRSKRIVQLLNRLPTIAAARPEKEARCLACHSVPHDPATATVPASILADGIGCEMCHGPAKNWLAKHTEKPWINDYHTGKFTLLPDMNDTRSLLNRAKTCAGCHVGSAVEGQPVRDVNHDLIAAGHPRLSFEFHAFLSVMPKHWYDGAATPGAADFKPGFETDRATHAKAWAIGQVVAAEAALSLLEHRAAEAAKGSAHPWPEFSEYDCFACHHQLDGKSLSSRQRGAEHRTGPTRFGSLPWGTWYFPEVRFLIDSKPFGEWYDNFGKPLADLRAEISRPGATPARIASLANKAAAAMHGLSTEIARSTFDRKVVDTLLDSAVNKEFHPADWDEAAQRLLTLEALWKARQFFQSQSRATPGKDEEAISDALESIRKRLQFSSDDSARPSRRFDSPVGFDAEAIRSDAFEPAFVEIRKLLPRKESK